MATVPIPPEGVAYLRHTSANSPEEPPRASYYGQMQRALVQALGRYVRQCFSFVRTYEDTSGTGAGSLSVSAKTEVWRARFVTPHAATHLRIFITHTDRNSSSTSIQPRIFVSLTNVSDSGSPVEYQYDAGQVASNVLYSIDKVRTGEIKVEITARKIYNVAVSIQDYATPIAVQGVAWAEETSAYPLSPPTVGDQLTDDRLLDLRRGVQRAWCYGGATLLQWSAFNSSLSVTGAGWNKIFNSALQFRLPYVNRGRLSKYPKVYLAAYATCSASLDDRLRLTNSGGSLTLQIGGSGSPAWYSTSGRFTGTDETFNITVHRQGSNWTLYAVSVFLLED